MNAKCYEIKQLNLKVKLNDMWKPNSYIIPWPHSPLRAKACQLIAGLISTSLKTEMEDHPVIYMNNERESKQYMKIDLKGGDSKKRMDTIYRRDINRYTGLLKHSRKCHRIETSTGNG